MNHDSHKACALALALAGALAAQNQATTLTSLCQRADVVVVATVAGSTEPVPGLLRLTLQTKQTLKGSISQTFALTEPAGRCCGRALFTMPVGTTGILFLDRIGPTLHTLGGGRGVLAATPDLLAHTQALLQSSTNQALTHTLANNLSHHEPRIAHDAAHALAALPKLVLTSLERSNVTLALTASVQRGSTATAALADVAARLGDARMIDSIMPIYLDARREDQASLLRKALVRCAPEVVAERVPIFVGRTRRANLRAAELLTKMPAYQAHAAMTDLLSRSSHPQVKMHLCEGFLEAGVTAASLQPLVPKAVLELALARRKRQPTFKNINPNR